MSRYFSFHILFLAVMAMSSVTRAGNAPDPAGFLAGEYDGWRGAGEDRTYDRKTLFRHIDGGAEIYLAYDFRRVLVRTLTRKGEPSLNVEIYDMGTSFDAFGIFSFEREGKELGIGQGSEYGGGLLRFWKDRFFVCAYADRETPAAKKALLGMGTAVARAIKSTGKRPQILDILPADRLEERRIRYFHHHQCLNYHYWLSDANLLNLDGKPEALLADYAGGGGTAHLLLVLYEDAASAEAAGKNFIAAYMPEAKKTLAARMENGKWTAAALRGAYLSIVFEAPSRDSAEALLESVKRRMEEKGL
jgi:hypothetical protein